MQGMVDIDEVHGSRREGVVYVARLDGKGLGRVCHGEDPSMVEYDAREKSGGWVERRAIVGWKFLIIRSTLKDYTAYLFPVEVMFELIGDVHDARVALLSNLRLLLGHNESCRRLRNLRASQGRSQMRPSKQRFNEHLSSEYARLQMSL